MAMDCEIRRADYDVRLPRLVTRDVRDHAGITSLAARRFSDR